MFSLDRQRWSGDIEADVIVVANMGALKQGLVSEAVRRRRLGPFFFWGGVVHFFGVLALRPAEEVLPTLGLFSNPPTKLLAVAAGIGAPGAAVSMAPLAIVWDANPPPPKLLPKLNI